MKNNVKTFVLFCLTVLIAGCCCNNPAETPEENDYYMFGSYTGNCEGNLFVDIYKLENNVLYEDGRRNYPSFEEMPYNGKFYQVEYNNIKEVKELMKNIPRDLLSEENLIIGAPNGRELGGVIIQIRKEGVVKSWLIDANTERIPVPLRGYVDNVKKVVDKIVNY